MNIKKKLAISLGAIGFLALFLQMVSLGLSYPGGGAGTP